MAGATTIREATQRANRRLTAAVDGADRAGVAAFSTANAPLMPPGTPAEGLTSVVVWKRQPGGVWWPHMDIWNAGTERDDAIRARRSRPTSRSDSR